MPERAGIVTRAGHICMICGFLPTTKNKYRELQDHLVRKHFNEKIKAALPTRRPYICPEPSCPIEGKDWQALMRHYTGKHGILESFLREIIDNGLTLPPNPKHVKRQQAKMAKQRAAKEAREAKKFGSNLEQYKEAEAGENNNLIQVSIDAPPTIPQATMISPPERIGVRRKRPSHNSTGSASSPESCPEEEEGKPEHHQLALVVKRAKPNGEDAYALIDLKCLIASSTLIPHGDSQLITQVAGENAHLNVLGDSVQNAHEKEPQELGTHQLLHSLKPEASEDQQAMQQPQQHTLDQMIHLAPQIPVSEQLLPGQVQVQQPADLSGQIQQQQQCAQISAPISIDSQLASQENPIHILLPQQPLPQASSSHLAQANPPQIVQHIENYDQQQIQFDAQQIIQAIEEPQYDDTVLPIYVTPSGEVIQINTSIASPGSLQIQPGEQQQIQIVQTGNEAVQLSHNATQAVHQPQQIILSPVQHLPVSSASEQQIIMSPVQTVPVSSTSDQQTIMSHVQTLPTTSLSSEPPPQVIMSHPPTSLSSSEQPVLMSQIQALPVVSSGLHFQQGPVSTIDTTQMQAVSVGSIPETTTATTAAAPPQQARSEKVIVEEVKAYPIEIATNNEATAQGGGGVTKEQLAASSQIVTTSTETATNARSGVKEIDFAMF